MDFIEYFMILIMVFFVAIAMMLFAAREVLACRRDRKIMENFNMFVAGITPRTHPQHA